jgi:hypothetical protein
VTILQAKAATPKITASPRTLAKINRPGLRLMRGGEW